MNELAIVTGASSGIGKAFAFKLAKEGLDLCIIAKNHSALEEVKNEISDNFNVNVTVLVADLSNSIGLKKVEEYINLNDNIKYLINNAGKTYLGPSYLYSLEKENEIMNLHMNSVVRLSHSVIKQMMKKGEGNIINVSSFSGLLNKIPNETLYSCTKLFQISFSETIKYSLKNTNIKVQALCPGYTYTNFHKTSEFITNNKNVYEQIPKIFWMNPDDVASISLKKIKSSNKCIVIPGLLNKILVLLGNSIIIKIIQGVKK